MNDYMKKTAQKSAQQNSAVPIQAKTNGIPNSVLNDVFAGKRQATSEMMGHSQNLAPSIAAKMSRAFGMDLTGMQVYQSDAMAGTGMQGMAQGNKVVLSSEVNLNTTAGQAVLGHEISHIHAQSQGVGMGHSGLYENAALEHQADTEGLLAAQGRSIYSDGMDAGIGMQYGLGMKGVEGLTPLSGGMSANAGAPMQAWKFGAGAMAGKAKRPTSEKQARGLAYEYARQLQEGFINKYGKNDDPNTPQKVKDRFNKTSYLKMGSEFMGMQDKLKDFVDYMPIPERELERMEKDARQKRKDIDDAKKSGNDFDPDEDISVGKMIKNKKDHYRESMYNELVNPHGPAFEDCDFTGTSLQEEMRLEKEKNPFGITSPFMETMKRINTKMEKSGNGRYAQDQSGTAFNEYEKEKAASVEKLRKLQAKKQGY